MKVGDNIKAARVKAGLTQAELGEMCGIAKQTIGMYERGKLNPKYETVSTIAEALGTTVADLLENAEDVTKGLLKAFSFNQGLECAFSRDHLRGIAVYMSMLNEKGQKEAVKRIHELTKIPWYQKDSTDDQDQDEE